MTDKTLMLCYVNVNAGQIGVRSLPLGLEFVAAAAKQTGWRVIGRYWGAELSVESFAKDLQATAVDAIGFYVDMLNVYTIARLLRRLPQEVRPITILGGPEATFNYRQLAAMSCAEVIVRGDGEPAIMELLGGDLTDPDFLSSVEGISYRANGGIHHNPPRSADHVVDVLPDRDLLPDPYDILYLYTARGCPHRCSFCSESSVPFRPRRLESIFRELDYELPRRQPKWILIVDDTFTAESDRARQIMRYLKEAYGGPWSCEVTASSINREPSLAAELADAGLARVQIGIESMNDETLRLYRKSTTQEKTLRAISLLLEAGVKCVFGNFIVGAPDETEAMIHRNQNIALELIRKYPGRVELSASVLSYNPGAPFFDTPERFGLTLSEESILEATDMRSAVLGSKTLSRQQITVLHEEFCATLVTEADKVLSQIPRDIVRSHLFFNSLDLSTIWSKRLLSNRFIARYYQQVYCGKSHRDISDIPVQALPDAIPQRTGMQVQHSMSGKIILTGMSGKLRELNTSASFLYEMACGMHSIRRIAEMMQQRLPHSDPTPYEQILSDTVGFFTKLGEQMQIVFVVP